MSEDDDPVHRFHIVSGEYPPEPGGVADYTASLAQALAAEGHESNVWCGGEAAVPIEEPRGVKVHRVAGGFGPSGLARLEQGLRRSAGPRTLLVQYVPHAFGWKAMNLPFTAWVAWRAWLGDDVRVMFHEVAFPWVRRPFRHNVLAAVNRAMASILVRSCRKAFVSIPSWIPMLRQLGARRMPIEWTPVPSNVPNVVPPEVVEKRRVELLDHSRADLIVGHFGTYGAAFALWPSVIKLLAPVIRELLDRRPNVMVLLLGAGGDRWREELCEGRPDWSRRVIAPGSLPAVEVAQHLQACDLMIQPYPDGVSSRRGTTMAVLANGVPLVTMLGELSEPFWTTAPVAAAPAGEPSRMVQLAEELLDSSARRAELRREGRQLYEGRFALRHTVAALLASP